MSIFNSMFEMLTPMLTQSQFYEQGVMTAEEFVKAGDQLVSRCATWQWSAGLASYQKSYLPKDKQFLITRGAPSSRRAMTYLADGLEEQFKNDDNGIEWTVTHVDRISDNNKIENKQNSNNNENNNNKQEDDIPDLETYDFNDDIINNDDDDNVVQNNDNEENKNTIMKVEEPVDNRIKVRTYDLSILYDKRYRCPRIYIVGYDENNQPLTHDQITQDISSDHANKTVTQEAHPHTGIMSLSIHPCKHSITMKRLLDMMVEHEKLLILNDIKQAKQQLAIYNEQVNKDKQTFENVKNVSTTTSAQFNIQQLEALANLSDKEIDNKALDMVKKKMPVENYLFLFLKFVQAVIPTIEYDYTVDMNMS